MFSENQLLKSSSEEGVCCLGRTKAMYNATPTGINITPKKTIGAMIFRDTLSCIQRDHIHRVTKISPATMCAQAAAAPAGVPKRVANPSRIVVGSLESLAKLMRTCGSARVIIHHMRIGPRKNHGPSMAFCVKSCSGYTSIPNQNGPTHIVERKNERVYKSMSIGHSLGI